MGFLKNCVLFIFSMLSLGLTIVTTYQFTKFLSDFSSEKFTITIKPNSTVENKLEDVDSVAYTTQALVVDISLLCLFIIQHSSLVPLQDVISAALKLPVLNRTLLNILTSASLQLLMYFWKPIPQYTLWIINTDEASRQLAFIGTHAFSWLLIYVMMLTMDITDLLGLKQVYYYTTGRPASMLKSQQLKNLHYKMRHPSLLGFALIFWVYPFMRLDRLLLAVVWTLYMLLAWRPDASAYNYVVQQQAVKNSLL